MQSAALSQTANRSLEMDFFEKFKQAEYEFTYGALDDPENYNEYR